MTAGRRPFAPAGASVALALSLVGATGCERERLPELCPDVQAGELVLTELRGPQAGSDTYGQWFELLNTGAETIDLTGLQLIVTPGDGSDPARLIVREGVDVAAGAYVVLGRGDLGEAPAHMDYAFGPEFDGGLDPSGVVEVVGCGEQIDRFVWLELPTEGSYAFDGSKSPTSEANDDTSCWCADATEPPPDGPMTEIGLPGTPGEENRTCP